MVGSRPGDQKFCPQAYFNVPYGIGGSEIAYLAISIAATRGCADTPGHLGLGAPQASEQKKTKNRSRLAGKPSGSQR
jgi:hypothetical protein